MAFIKQKKSSFQQLSDSELVKTIVQSNNRKMVRALQMELYNRYVEKVYFKCISLVKNEEVAKDLAHDILVKIFMKLKSFRGDAQFTSWVFSITYNHCITYLNRQKRLPTTDLEKQIFQISEESDEVIQHKILQEFQYAQLEVAFKKLSEREKIILLMRYQDGFSIKQIAKTLKLTEGATKMRLKRSRDHLAEVLRNLEERED